MKALIIADAPNKLELPNIAYDSIIALDGAADKLQELSILPNFLIGDLDTIKGETIEKLEKSGVRIIKNSNQNYSDLDKGINLADALGASSITICNAQGGRMDHSLYNLKILRTHYNTKRGIQLHTGSEVVEFLKNTKVAFSGSIGSNFAIFGMPHATVNTQGLLYDLNSYELEFGISESSSNSFAKKTVTLEVDGEVIIITQKNVVKA